MEHPEPPHFEHPYRDNRQKQQKHDEKQCPTVVKVQSLGPRVSRI